MTRPITMANPVESRCSSKRSKSNKRNKHENIQTFNCQNFVQKSPNYVESSQVFDSWTTPRGVSRNYFGLKKLECDLCNYKTDTEYDLNLHKRISCPKRQTFKCSDCEEDFLQKQELVKHRSSVHGKKNLYYFPFKCPECDRSSTTHHGLVKHIQQRHLNNNVQRGVRIDIHPHNF